MIPNRRFTALFTIGCMFALCAGAAEPGGFKLVIKNGGMRAGGEALGIYARPDAPEKVWACIGGSLYASTDGGDHWAMIESGKGLAWIAADPSKPGRFYFSGSKRVYVTDDG